MTTQFQKNLLASYNEAIDNNRMSEETARTSIENKYGVVFTNFTAGRYTQISEADKCFVTGCSNKATHLVTPLFDAPIMKMCDHCKPDINKRPAALKNMPFTYRVEKL